MIERSKHYYDKDRNLPYKENTKENLRYFTLSEFDSPDLEGSGSNMKNKFLIKLDEARHLAGIPFKINSGFRTAAHNQYLLDSPKYKASKTSAHLDGLAADISVTDSRSRWIVINSLMLAGFVRIGIADTFIHVDLAKANKTQNCVWTY